MSTVRIIDNDDDRYEGWTLIECVDDTGQTVWRSWAPPEIDPAVRLNVDHPTATDDRTDTATTQIGYRVPTVEEASAHDLGITDPDHHRAVATYAAVVEAVPVEDAAAAVELDAQALVDEALAWEVAAL